jgi:hypothetical protein
MTTAEMARALIAIAHGRDRYQPGERDAMFREAAHRLAMYSLREQHQVAAEVGERA